MTDKEQNKSEVHQEPISKDIAGMNSRGKDRRRFIKRAIVAAPFILTVASRPVWAINCTMSGQLSGNLSDAAGEECGGEGCSAEYWEGNHRMWHHEFQPDCVFDSVFRLSTEVFGKDTLSKVISKSGNPKKDLGREAVAALQNAAGPVSYDFTVYQVIDMVRTAFDSGDNNTAFDSGDNNTAFDSGDNNTAFDSGDNNTAFDSGDNNTIETLEATLRGLNGRGCQL